jgi:hypothetical protein
MDGQDLTPEELAKCLLVTPEQVAAIQAKPKPKRERLPRATAPFVRIWSSCWGDSRLYPAHARLFHVLIQLSREGRKNPVELTAAVAEMAKISPPHRSRHARHLEKLGLVCIERHNQGMLILTVIPDPIVRCRE